MQRVSSRSYEKGANSIVFSENRTGFLYEGFENGRKAEAGLVESKQNAPSLFYFTGIYMPVFFFIHFAIYCIMV